MLSKSETRTVNVHESYIVLPEEAQTAGGKVEHPISGVYAINIKKGVPQLL